MKQLFLVAAMAMGAAGCADDLRPIQIRDARPLDVACAAADFSLYSGSLDLASLDNGVLPEQLQYVMQFTVASQLEAEGVSVGDNPIADQARNNFIVEEIEYNFESQPVLPFQQERRPAYLVIPAGKQDNLMNVMLIPPNVLTTLRTRVTKEQSVTLISRFRLKGKLASGVATESDEVAFPITVFDSGTRCLAPAVLEFTGSCGGPSGINSNVTCKAPTTTP